MTASESTLDALLTGAMTVPRLKARREALEREASDLQRRQDALKKQEKRLRREYRRTLKWLGKGAEQNEKLAAFLSTVENERDRALLQMRYLDGMTIPQMKKALDARGICYAQRYVERLLYLAEKAARAQWDEAKKKEEEHAEQCAGTLSG